MPDAALKLGNYSIGVGDRFAHQAGAQLEACRMALAQGVEVVPVWNKSNREHIIIGSEPASVRLAADSAVAAAGWTLPYFCDADHITLQTVGRFLSACDYYTIDVAEFIGQRSPDEEVERFVQSHPELQGAVKLEAAGQTISISPQTLRQCAQQYLKAVRRAGEVYRAIEQAKGAGNFIAEISMDETENAQSPAELLMVLAAIADEGIPIQTIAPKFSGRFNKGVEYVGDAEQFEREMGLDVAVIAHAVRQYRLAENLKLSVHSGSDKFSIYPAMHATIQRFGAGLHLKTAGTSWLEELIGLAEAGGDGLEVAKEIYAEAHARREELCAPYATVIDIDVARLPLPAQVRSWTSEQYTAALRHVPGAPAYNNNLRQLLHVGFKVAAKMGDRYLGLLKANRQVIAKNVTANLFDRHIAPVFLGRRPNGSDAFGPPTPLTAE